MDRGQSLIIPPLFDGTNNAYWKVRMRVFMQSLDKKVWQAIEIGQTKPKEALTDWDEAKIKAANFNSRALNALFSAVANKEFKKISSTETAQEAWTILQITYKGTKAVKDSKLQRLTTSFEEIKMEEDKSFDEFYQTQGHSKLSLQSWGNHSLTQDCKESAQISTREIPRQDYSDRRIKGY